MQYFQRTCPVSAQTRLACPSWSGGYSRVMVLTWWKFIKILSCSHQLPLIPTAPDCPAGTGFLDPRIESRPRLRLVQLSGHGQKNLHFYRKRKISDEGFLGGSKDEYLALEVLLSLKTLVHCVCMISCFSYVSLFETLWTVAHQASLSMGFSRQEYWSGFPGIFLTQGSDLYLLGILHCRRSFYRWATREAPYRLVLWLKQL